jgi:hypothetical protein
MDPGELADQIVKAAVSSVAGRLAGEATQALLRVLLAVQDRQVELMLELRADVSLLRKGSWGDTTRKLLEVSRNEGSRRPVGHRWSYRGITARVRALWGAEKGDRLRGATGSALVGASGGLVT